MTTKITDAVKRAAATVTDTLAEAAPLAQAIIARIPWFVVKLPGIEATVTTAAPATVTQQPATSQEQGKTCPHCGR